VFAWDALFVWGRSLCRVLLLAGFLAGLPLVAEETFETLDTGSGVFTNVAVLTKSKTHISFNHERGFATVKLTDLDSNTLHALGYIVAPPKPARRPLALPKEIKVDPRLQAAQQQFTAQVRTAMGKMDTMWVVFAGCILVLLYLFFTFCCQQICRKAGLKPNGFIWLPVLQMIPLLQAARMSGWYFLLLLVPAVGLLVYLFWCINICKARHKSSFVAFLLFLPPTTLFAFLYLAFSDGGEEDKKDTSKIQLAYQ
jgi:uncharacterized membrane protein YhaH (DUF805 family)